MNIESKIALTMSADGDSFERVHSNLVKITHEFAIDYESWCSSNSKYDLGVSTSEDQLKIYKKEKGL